MKILKELKGHSNSQILLVEENNRIFVRKNFDIERNIERYIDLNSLNITIPLILNVSEKSYDMEYIHHLDMKQFLLMNDCQAINFFISKILNLFKTKSIDYDYSEIFEYKLSKFDFEKYQLPFTRSEIFAKLPKILPKSPYHGDLTLENILFDLNRQEFVLIDPLTTEYDSYVFDIAKLKQDLVCGWFIRNENYYLDSKLKIILDSLNQFKYSDDDYLLILMLLRVLPYTKNENDKNFILNCLRKLWK